MNINFSLVLIEIAICLSGSRLALALSVVCNYVFL